jgi:hypothetical protein
MFIAYIHEESEVTKNLSLVPTHVRIQAFADRMQISVWTARNWAYSGKIATCKPSKHLLVPISEVERLEAEGARPRCTSTNAA